MEILVTGATGLVGQHFIKLAEARGHTCVALTRRPRSANDVAWDPEKQQIDTASLEGFAAVVHLAGESIAQGRWTTEKKRRIRDSRVHGTELLSRTLAGLNNKPLVLVSASAIGYYGDRRDEPLDEESSAGDSFLADVCRDWEQATAPAAEAGIRVANTRLGIVLASEGGALKQMVTPFRFGVGGIVGNGRQYWSWISIDDVAGGLLFVIETPELAKAINLVAPEPSTNYEFTKTLGKVLKRPTLVPMPAFAARLALGEMADELLLASARVYPRKLTAAGYSFQYADLETALGALLVH